MSVQWQRPMRVQWLGRVGVGAYTGYDKIKENELAKEIIARRGAIDEESLKAYGKVGGTIAGAGLCAGAGPAASVGCGIIGGIIGEWIGSKIPVAHGSTMEDLVVDTMSSVSNKGKVSARAIYSVRAYLTMRDLAITKGLATDASLTAAGCPPAPVNARWKPSSKRHLSAQSSYADALIQLGQSSAWKKECDAAKSIGVVNSKFTCQDYLYAVYYNGWIGPVAAAGEPIDWSAVGQDEYAFQKIKLKKDCEYFIHGAPTNETSLTCPTNAPTTLAQLYTTKLNQTVKWPKGPLVPGVPDLSNILFPSSGGSGSGTSPVIVFGGIAAAIAAAWWVFV